MIPGAPEWQTWKRGLSLTAGQCRRCKLPAGRRSTASVRGTVSLRVGRSPRPRRRKPGSAGSQARAAPEALAGSEGLLHPSVGAARRVLIAEAASEAPERLLDVRGRQGRSVQVDCDEGGAALD